MIDLTMRKHIFFHTRNAHAAMVSPEIRTLPQRVSALGEAQSVGASMFPVKAGPLYIVSVRVLFQTHQLCAGHWGDQKGF